MAEACCTPLLCPWPALLSIYWLWTAIWKEFSWHTSYTLSDCHQHRYVTFVPLLPGQSGISMALTIHSHTGKPSSPNSSLTWITGPCYPILLALQIQPKTSCFMWHEVSSDCPEPHDSSSLMLWHCHHSEHLFWLFLDSPRFACCLGLPSGYCHPFLFKESQCEQYATSLSIACGLYLASSQSSILYDWSCLMS